MDNFPISVSVALPPSLLAKVQAAADEEHRPAGDMLREAVEHYLAYRLLKRRGRIVRQVEELSDTELKAIAATEMDQRHAHLDRELD